MENISDKNENLIGEIFTLYDIFDLYYKFFKDTIWDVSFIDNYKLKTIISAFDKAMRVYDIVVKTLSNYKYIKNNQEISMYQNYINNNKQRLDKVNNMTNVELKLRMYKSIYYDELKSIVNRLERLIQKSKIKELGYILKNFNILLNCIGNVLDSLSHEIDIDIIDNN